MNTKDGKCTLCDGMSVVEYVIDHNGERNGKWHSCPYCLQRELDVTRKRIVILEQYLTDLMPEDWHIDHLWAEVYGYLNAAKIAKEYET